ncbi:hypothetical protein [Clostridium sp. UBA7339]|uniref:hypothetical protein n=1 Tax=Clostridium sp. UBA7339 TaxID=1946376 RepID=UPI0032176272
MANQKLIFSNEGTIKTIDNYVLSKEEEDASRDVLKHEEDIEDPYTYMDIEDIKNLEAKKKKVSNKSKAIKENSSQDKSYGLTNHSRASSKINRIKKKMGRQETLLNSSGKESLRRTYLIEVENIKRLEEIKVFLYSDEVVQYNELVNEAAKHYYECMKIDKGKKKIFPN